MYAESLENLQVFEMADKIEIMNRLLEGQSALDLVAEQNGNHVIQKCIECIKPASQLQPLVKVGSITDTSPLEQIARLLSVLERGFSYTFLPFSHQKC